ncbi:MAG: 50S ribosomal protein L4 [Clostridiales bacterium]|nr:50S ribosomal protein L4 [Clostridiales bacterium]
MPKVTLLNINGEQVGEIELSDEIFGISVHRQAMHDVVVSHLAKKRRGTHATKNRAEVRGGGKKPWRQKGTGRARQGTRRSPIWVGGGTVFGPSPRNYSNRVPKKVRRLALKSALSSKVNDGEIKVLDNLSMEYPKTKEMNGILKNLDINSSSLIVTARADENVYKSARNIPGTKFMPAQNLNVYDVLSQGTLVITRDAVSTVEEALKQ